MPDSEMFHPRPEARTRLTESADHSFFLSSYGTNLDLKFEAIFRKSCRGLFEEKCVFWVTAKPNGPLFFEAPCIINLLWSHLSIIQHLFAKPHEKTHEKKN